MIAPPSLVHSYPAFFSRDPAFVQLERGELDDAAWKAAREHHAHLLRVARETGDWSPLLSGNGEPTKFVLRHVPGDVYRRLGDMALSKEIGFGTLNHMLVRTALLEVSNLGSHEVEFETHPKLGRIATAAVPNLLDRIDMSIVNELAAYVQERQTLSPK